MVSLSLCESISPLLQTVGHALSWFKLALPLILIVLGIIDIGKAAISSKSDDVKKHMKNLLYKVLLVVLVFFIPTIFVLMFNLIDEFNDLKKDEQIGFDACYTCLFKYNSDECNSYVENARDVNEENK